MIRTLITSGLLAGAAIHFLGTPAEIAIPYTVLIGLALWFLWPLLRRTHRRGRRRQPPPAPHPYPHPWPPPPTPQLTQINHHHYYGPPHYSHPHHGRPPMPAPYPPHPNHTLPALPQHTARQQAHDAIYDTIDPDQ
ncbi:MAG: hypothetical protein K0U84_20330 [Actinomycetia bacterium]|nr:hypothetical protein [Actinomycetes bacterium]